MKLLNNQQTGLAKHIPKHTDKHSMPKKDKRRHLLIALQKSKKCGKNYSSFHPMSRRPRSLIWFQWFGLAEWATCPVCAENIMHRDYSVGNDKRGAWHREHIIRLAIGGPDTHPNLISICARCNLAMGKAVTCTFDYMVKTGRMSAEEARMELHNHRQRCLTFDPRCEASLVSSKKRCSNLKAGKQELYCLKHIRAQLEPMDCSD